MTAAQIPSALREALAAVPYARAVLLAGSHAIGKAAHNSDWDFCVILTPECPPWRRTWKVADTWLEVFCAAEDYVRSAFKYDAQAGKGMTIAMFASGQIVSDSDDYVLRRLVRGARHRWARGPRALAPAEREQIDYTITCYIHDIEDCLQGEQRGDLIVNQALDTFVQCYYRLQQCWLPRPKDRFDDLQRRAPEYGSIVDQVGRESDWRVRSALTIAFGHALATQFALPLRGEVYIPPKKGRNI